MCFGGGVSWCKHQAYPKHDHHGKETKVASWGAGGFREDIHSFPWGERWGKNPCRRARVRVDDDGFLRVKVHCGTLNRVACEGCQLSQCVNPDNGLGYTTVPVEGARSKGPQG